MPPKRKATDRDPNLREPGRDHLGDMQPLAVLGYSLGDANPGADNLARGRWTHCYGGFLSQPLAISSRIEKSRFKAGVRSILRRVHHQPPFDFCDYPLICFRNSSSINSYGILFSASQVLQKGRLPISSVALAS